MPSRACLAWLCWLAATAAQAHESLVGRILPPYPEGLRDLQGTCLSDSDQIARICDYGIAVLGRLDDDRSTDAERLHVVAQRNVSRDEDGDARWEVTDAIPYPHAPPDYFLQMATCRIDGLADDHVAAMVRQDGVSTYSGDVTWARRLDFASGRLVEVDPGRVDCLNEFLGV
jgi:hypothetical protein